MGLGAYGGRCCVSGSYRRWSFTPLPSGHDIDDDKTYGGGKRTFQKNLLTPTDFKRAAGVLNLGLFEQDRQTSDT